MYKFTIQYIFFSLVNNSIVQINERNKNHSLIVNDFIVRLHKLLIISQEIT